MTKRILTRGIMTKRILDLDEIKEVQKKMLDENFFCKTLLKDWTEFVFNASTEGVSQYDIDELTMSLEDLDKKYNVR